MHFGKPTSQYAYAASCISEKWFSPGHNISQYAYAAAAAAADFRKLVLENDSQVTILVSVVTWMHSAASAYCQC